MDSSREARRMKPAENSLRWRTLLPRVVVTGVVLALWFWTQSLLGARTAPASGVGDTLHNLTASLNSYFAQNPAAADTLLIVSSARWAQKRIPESDAALAELIATAGETGAYQIAEVYGYRNDKDHAFEWLERARRQRDAGLPGLRVDTLLPNLHDDPRWNAFLRTMGLADDQLK